MDKKQIRQHMLKMRSLLSAQERTTCSDHIMSFLINTNTFANASQVASFVDFRDEVYMSSINDYILESKKSLYLPYINMQNKSMTFHVVKALSELTLNHYGILEPNPQKHPQVDLNSIDLVLAPGVAFDMKGFRLGYGGGFYDRFFDNLDPNTPKIGIAFSIQQLDRIPVESHDLSLTALITEKGIQWF